jgi:TRAP-type C4-dicarboxylate transport system substrate-binding protein
MIDAVPTVPFHALAMQFYTVAKNMLELNWVPLVGAGIISKKTWDALPEESRTELTAIAQETGLRFQATSRSEQAEAVETMRKRGLNVVAVSPAAEAEWRAVGESFHPRIRGSMVPADMFDEVVRLLAEYRSSRPN